MRPSPFAGFPFPMMMVNNGPDREERTLLTIVPARVHMAMSVLQYATHKTQPRAAVNDIMVQELDPVQLDLEEIDLMRTAAKTVKAYLQGELVLTPEEKKVMDGNDGPKGQGTLMRCTNCGGNRQVLGQRCRVCRGTGTYLAFPANPDGNEEGT